MSKTYNIYDPSVGAYREYSEEDARKFVESAKKVEKQLPEKKAADKEVKTEKDNE